MKMVWKRILINFTTKALQSLSLSISAECRVCSASQANIRVNDFIKIFDVVYEHVNLTENKEFKTFRETFSVQTMLGMKSKSNIQWWSFHLVWILNYFDEHHCMMKSLWFSQFCSFSVLFPAVNFSCFSSTRSSFQTETETFSSLQIEESCIKFLTLIPQQDDPSLDWTE